MDEWDRYEMMHTRLAAPVKHFEAQSYYPRKMTRSMGRVSLLALRATELALQQAGLRNDPQISDGRMGIAYGSSSGSVDPVRVFGQMLESGSMAGVTSTSYIQMMPHTAAVNVGLYFGLKGRVIPTSSACTSGSQAIGYAFEAIRLRREPMMVAGGAEELSAPGAAVFDTLFATSTKNDAPASTPRPFDKKRDGLVVGEGAATLVLEDLEHAKARGATPLVEIVGFATNSDGKHVTQPDDEQQARAMAMALADAGVPASAIGYVSAHGTATDRGDVAEARATGKVLGGSVPVASMKSYVGHTLGACGAIEAWWTIEMMRGKWFAPTINLENPDPECEGLDHIRGEGRTLDIEYAMKNNFAFGGINTSLVFRRI
jgi:3-oxoacyl-[acyl-carrier-protein] synthase II